MSELKNTIIICNPMITINGAKSKPLKSVLMKRLRYAYVGFVILYKNCTIGLNGSGFTKLKSAVIIRTQIYILIRPIKIPPRP